MWAKQQEIGAEKLFTSEEERQVGEDVIARVAEGLRSGNLGSIGHRGLCSHDCWCGLCCADTGRTRRPALSERLCSTCIAKVGVYDLLNTNASKQVYSTRTRARFGMSSLVRLCLSGRRLRNERFIAFGTCREPFQVIAILHFALKA